MLIFFIALGVTLCCTLLLLLSPMLLRPTPEAQRMNTLVQSARADQRVIGLRERLEDALIHLARRIRTLFGMTVNARAEKRLHAAGLRAPAAPDLFFGVQCLLPLVGAFGASFLADNTLFWVFASAAAGFLLPNLWLTEKIRRRRERIRRSLPDAIDLLVICVDAGLGLDQALLRVSQELGVSHPDIQHELSRVHLEQSAGRPRTEAWKNLSERVKLTEVSAFSTMLLQTDRFGTPIGRALSEFAGELRSRRRQAAEEAAAKTKIKIIFPLVLCIFPCLFIVLLAPAILSIGQGLSQMNK